jgi:hypothetical protein
MLNSTDGYKEYTSILLLFAQGEQMKNYTIWATLGDDLERIIEADFLDDVDLNTVKSRISDIYQSCDAFWNKLNAR